MRRKLRLTLTGMMVSAGLFAQISTFPNITDFESEAVCGTSCTGSCNPVGVWENADQYGFPQAGMDWMTHSGATPSSSTGPSIDHTTGTATGKYMYTETSGCNNVDAHLVSAIFDFSALSAPRIKFWYHMYGATMGTMHVDVDTTGLGNWVNDVVPAWTDNQDLWQMTDISLAAVAAGRPSVRIRIRGISGSSFTSDMAVDDIQVYQPAANDINCINVSAGGGCGNSPNTPVFISLNNYGSDTIPAGTMIPVSFEINSVVVTDTITTSAPVVPGDTLVYIFTNGYADLSGPGSVSITAWSAWSADTQAGNDTLTVTAMGIPIITSYPYYEDFESGQNGWTINNGSAGTWAFGTPAKAVINSAASGVNAFVNGGLTGSYNDNDNSYVEGPCFDFTNICDPVLSMSVWWNSEFSWDGMNVEISTDGGNTWSLVGNYGDPLNWYTDNTIAGNPGGSQEGWSGRASTSNGSGGWVTARHRLVGAGNMPNVKIRINFGSDGSVTDDGVAFDDVRIFNGTDLGPDQTVCSPATVNLNADHGNTSATYLWSTGETTGTITATTTGWYSVAITADVSCTTTDSIYIVAVDAQTQVMLGPDTSSCGTGVMLDAGYWPQSTYAWSNGDTTQMINAGTSGTYIASVTTGCGILADTIAVAVNPLPVVNLGNDSTWCGSAMLSSGNGNGSYLWSTSETSPMISVTASGMYFLDYTDSLGCSNSDTVNVMVNALPVLSVSGATAVCAGGSTTLTASGATSYVWENGPATDVNTVTLMADSSFVVTGTDNNGCSNNDTVMVMVNSLPVVNLGNDSAQCGGSVMLDAGPASMYSWSNGDTTQMSTASASGMYYVMVTDSNGCSNNDTVMITINSLPVVNLGNDSAQCGGSIMLDAGPASMYLWSNGDITQQSTVNASGIYYVTVTDSIGCTGSDTVMITINTPPTAGLALAFSSACVDDGSYVLSGGSPAGGIYSGPGVSGSNFDPSAAGVGTAVITYTYTDSLGCFGEATQSVAVNACVGYQEAFAGAMLSVFPNPSQGIFTLELDGLRSDALTIFVVDAGGRTVLEKQEHANGPGFRTDLDLSHLDNGIYFLVLRSGDTSKTVKLVLNK